MLILRNVSYVHTNRDLLFNDINLTINNNEKVALIGNNGVGKSTLLKIIAGEVNASSGHVICNTTPYYVPQVFGQFNHLTVAEAMQVHTKLNALKAILDGDMTADNFHLLQDDWSIEQRCGEALAYWKLSNVDLNQRLDTLSGGQKTKVFLAGMSIHNSRLAVLDEPSNHLDAAGRQLLYDCIQSSSNTLLIVSHDRILLNLLNVVCEFSKRGITTYGGNYNFYVEQKHVEDHALNDQIESKETALRKAKEKERETIERQQKQNARGKKKADKAGVPRVAINALRNNAEKSTSRLKSVHADKIAGISQQLKSLRAELPGIDKMRFDFDESALHSGKILFSASNLNVAYDGKFIWKENIDLQIRSGERIALNGLNGSGKTTLIKIVLGRLKPSGGPVFSAATNAVYIDQDYSLIKGDLNVYDQAQRFNVSAIPEHEVRIRLNRFLFTKEHWDKPCLALSGGEKMRLMICCLNIQNQSPDMIILDEPTNNLDIQNIEILTSAICDYKGTLIVVSHDGVFLEQIGINRVIEL